ncbi:MAG TPA: biotin--[acetyl-CoA-carboxylase] ligase [Ramlibacter sp.]|jgi:BirA family biotin operon repressor/biotin-[acetyl-CoA-carboxylase] ligase|uniref:biotin--[acetyl-CoA-carboxylase] ligase n=1 Tax=Ramlibacter sp. TaxID=1917967 RepID=UPI002D41E947|nr:biotin--[acetyl-CoA-carboxylase] ligase [Ramlibacter sp.]HZY17160.1 biotin--[acetyl-CoA-carboxylase] ligase [Ramlibacter sp.]
MHWPAEAIWEQVAPWLPGFTVEVLPQVDSTNSELMRRARAGSLDPILLVAEQQTAGRGRLGRSWQSDTGGSLTFSLGLSLAPRDWSGLSLAVGLAAAEALHSQVRLKWPNDLWVGDRKLGGILVETAGVAGSPSRTAVVGIGLNLARPPADGLSTAPAGLNELLPGLDRGQVLLRLAAPVLATLRRFEEEGFSPFVEGFRRRDALAGRQVRLSDGTTGTAAAIGEDGALLVHTAAGLVAVGSADVSVRPA